MEETLYNILIDNEIIATNLRLDHAVIFIKALFQEYYAQAATIGLKITIEAIPSTTDCNK